MEIVHERRQIRFGEVLRAHAGVELRQTEVDGVGAIFDCGAGAFPVAGGSEQFRAAQGRR